MRLLKKLYESPFQVYLVLGLLAVLGLWSGFNLPISLFPEAARPTVACWIQYGRLNAASFRSEIGRTFEANLRGLAADGATASAVEANYFHSGMQVRASFSWGDEPDVALRQTNALLERLRSRLSDDAAAASSCWPQNDDSGFLAIAITSEQRTPAEIYALLNPKLAPALARISDAQNARLWRPDAKEVVIALDPMQMAALNMAPHTIEQAIRSSAMARQGGTLPANGNYFDIFMPSAIVSLDTFRSFLVPSQQGTPVPLSSFASIELKPKRGEAAIYKTNGHPSLILFSGVRPGGNIDAMAHGVQEALREALSGFADDIHAEVLVNPAVFIRSAVRHIMIEVVVAAALAVAVLLLFLGSWRHVLTAAIEIPLSIVLALIVMRLTGVNLNLISLGGLALSAGMNVDASVVVIESIVLSLNKHRGHHTFKELANVVYGALREIRGPLVASTLASILVFIPLFFTDGLAYALLGDLAKAVVYSHFFSAIVAVILVPTVRLHFSRKMLQQNKFKSDDQSIMDSFMKTSERSYARMVSYLAKRPVTSTILGGFAVVMSVGSSIFIVNSLPRELVSKPDTDYVQVSIESSSFSSIQEMERHADQIDHELRAKYSNLIQSTFLQVHGQHNATLLVRLAHREDKKRGIDLFQGDLPNTTQLRFLIKSWSPSEMPLPDLPDMMFELRGENPNKTASITEQLTRKLEAENIFTRVWSEPFSGTKSIVSLRPDTIRWAKLRESGEQLSPADIINLIEIATSTRLISSAAIDGEVRDIRLSYADNWISKTEDIGAIPINMRRRIIPLAALVDIEKQEAVPTLKFTDGQLLFTVNAKGMRTHNAERYAESMVHQLVSEMSSLSESSGVSIGITNPKKDIDEALSQLFSAGIWSLALMAIILALQFGNFVEVLLVMLAIPFGIGGALTSLYIFDCPLSLNGLLGAILLTGLVVANSILLVDRGKVLYEKSLSPEHAVALAAKRRLRPIMITSLTTVLGMLPLALGWGEGGSVLRPLAIAVIGGFSVSLVMTLLIIPPLQAVYLSHISRNR